MRDYNDPVAKRIRGIHHNPWNHRHDHEGLAACCSINGSPPLKELLAAHAGVPDVKGKKRCDQENCLRNPCPAFLADE